ncbi:hypothetical protein BBK14_01920 [Parafrankia soli]|uniref:Uncharacterized protein n=1 Tax=Parafrankia soli TaxID=2599596 RepID=A0A1S1RLE4_9ACTN|nr:hypothetical protein [Parafrankia soli]OHV46629.1 hypothetical protein BBK14_01920 [Parafrankia soli]
MSVTAEETYHRIRQVRVTVDRMTISALALFVKRAQELGIDPRTQVEADRSQVGHWTTVKAVERAQIDPPDAADSGPPDPPCEGPCAADCLCIGKTPMNEETPDDDQQL